MLNLWKMKALTQTCRILQPPLSRSCTATAFPVFLMDVDQSPIPIPWKFGKDHNSEEKQMVSLHRSASLLLRFCHQLLGGLGRKSYKKKLLEFADRTGIRLKPLAVYALLWCLACWVGCSVTKMENNLIVPLDELVQESLIVTVKPDCELEAVYLYCMLCSGLS